MKATRRKTVFRRRSIIFDNRSSINHARATRPADLFIGRLIRPSSTRTRLEEVKFAVSYIEFQREREEEGEKEIKSTVGDNRLAIVSPMIGIICGLSNGNTLQRASLMVECRGHSRGRKFGTQLWGKAAAAAVATTWQWHQGASVSHRPVEKFARE